MDKKLSILIILFIISKIKSESFTTLKKYETGKILSPDNTGIAYFFLEVTDFETNENIYGYFTSHEKDRNNLIFRYKFIDTIDISTIAGYEILNDNVFKDDGDNRNYYFNFKKKKENAYLAFYVKKKDDAFDSIISFTNTEDDEGKKVLIGMIIGIVVSIVVIVGIVLICVFCCCRKKQENNYNNNTQPVQMGGYPYNPQYQQQYPNPQYQQQYPNAQYQQQYPNAQYQNIENNPVNSPNSNP